ncbi:MAG: excinuclease ABC subunit UvrC [Desulfatiglandales bacterium]
MNPIPNPKPDLDPEFLRRTLPEKPGVYLFKDQSGEVIYIGKAKNLKKRVLSYFRPPTDRPYKTGLMMDRARDLDYILTSTEKEAFILESSLVKKYLPRYNVVLRDDKQYPCLRLDIKDPYPRLSIVRRIKKDGALYYGPFSSAQDVRKTLKLIDRIFQLRKCKTSTLPKRSRPCLNHQLNRCLGLCTRQIPPNVYKEVVDQVRYFLEGRNRELIIRLRKKMGGASEALNFEEAARIRDQIKAVEHVIEGQHVVSPRLEDQDIISLEEREGVFQIVLLFIRKGYLTGSRDYVFRDKGGTASEVMEAFLKQYYHRERFIPGQILVSESVEDLPGIREWVSDLAGKRVSIERPLRGDKARLVKMARANARNLLETRQEAEPQDLMSLAGTVLNLDRPPRSIECLDISNIQGDLAVGAVVSFVDGLPNRGGYRSYKIKEVNGIDDYGMMTELVSRRLAGDHPPDIFLLDGGKGHLMAAQRALSLYQGPAVPALVAIAKGRGPDEPDKVYVPGRKNPLSLRGDSPLLHFFMRIRDEAHRRAVTYHRKLRGKRLQASELDKIPGIGPRRKRLLLTHLGNIEAVSLATHRELVKIPGISPTLAEEIVRFFGGQ